MKIVYGNKEELQKQIAKEFAQRINSKEKSNVILATGNSPVGLYNEMINLYNKGELSFKNVTSYNLDEYLGMDEITKKYAFRKFMNDNLFNKVDIDKNNTFFPEEGTESYNEKLDKVDKMDWTLLGVGSNGHIAFNEPGTPFSYRTNEVVLKKSTIADNFPNPEEILTSAITMGMYDIYNKSSKIVLLAWGNAKKPALDMLVKGIKTDEWPITHFTDHPCLTIYTDIEEFKGE